MPSHCSLGLLPSRGCALGLWKRSAARARLADVVAELTGCLGRDERRGGEVLVRGATILAERVWLIVEIGGGWYRLRELGALFSLPFGLCGRVGDLDSFRACSDIAEVDREIGAAFDEAVESVDCRRLLIGIRDVDSGGPVRGTRVTESGGVGYSAGAACRLKSGILGAGCGRKASISLRLRLWFRVYLAGGANNGVDMS